ncbi:MAG: hypothetical protein SF162_03270 [bacterium]|nr:hypothetical protein [bacterium]
MRRVKVTLPATITHLGTGLHSLALAVGLHATIEITERTDSALNVETSGEDAGRYALGLRHPVVLGMARVFQKLERAVPGLNVRIESHIPAALGLGLETTFFVAGIIGANNLFGSTFKRADILRIAAHVTGRPDQAVTAMVGGMTASMMQGDEVVYRSLPIAPLKLVIALPHLPGYADKVRLSVPDRVPVRDALHNINRLPLLIDALRQGDVALAGQMMDDRVFAPYRTQFIPNFDDIAQIARLNGASAVTLCGSGPGIVALAAKDHARIADSITAGFEDIGIRAQSWIVPLDTQGVVLSVAQTG